MIAAMPRHDAYPDVDFHMVPAKQLSKRPQDTVCGSCHCQLKLYCKNSESTLKSHSVQVSHFAVKSTDIINYVKTINSGSIAIILALLIFIAQERWDYAYVVKALLVIFLLFILCCIAFSLFQRIFYYFANFSHNEMSPTLTSVMDKRYL